MSLHPLDWLIIFTAVAALMLVAWYTKRYTRSVSDFLSANRSAGRYLLTMAEGMSGLGAISIVANWEKFYQAGFAASFWGQMLAPIGLIIALSGWVAYRFRETRALTMAQFFERRYSRRFRVFTGILAWVSGVINYAIFPLITARFFVYFTGLPVYEYAVGPLTLNLTMGLVMGIFLATAVFFALSGGQIAVMVTDFLQGQFTNLVFLGVLGLLLWVFPWDTIVDTLKQAPAGHSMLDPFDQGELPDFGPSFFFMMAFLGFYGYMSWQGTQGYYTSAKTPHEAKMSRILAGWRGGVTYLLISLMPICAYVLLNSSLFGPETQATQEALAAITDEQARTQMTTGMALSQILPIGLTGLFCAVMVMAAISTDDTYLHSWGSIFIQDVVLPLRKKPLDTYQHLRLLRWSIVAVAIFAWCFSMIFPLKQYILMWFQITGAIYLGGAGAVIIGGLYWSRGTTAGAWAAMITGSVLALLGIFTLNIFWPYLLPWIRSTSSGLAWAGWLPEEFPLNGVELSFWSSLIAVVVYAGVSALTCRKPINMDRLLHRGEYRIEGEHFGDGPPPLKRGWKSLGITSEFTLGDKVIYVFKLAWSIGFFGIFVTFTVMNLFDPWGADGWAAWWYINLWIGIVVGTLTTVWFLIGGFVDLRDLFRTLATLRREADDDGTVREHLGQTDEPDSPGSADSDRGDQAGEPIVALRGGGA